MTPTSSSEAGGSGSANTTMDAINSCIQKFMIGEAFILD